MLILSRRLDESLILTTDDGLHIEIKVIDFSHTPHGNHKVQLGINADKSVKILREELIDGEPKARVPR